MIELSLDERRYLQTILSEHRDYYRLLAGSSQCSVRNKELYHLVETLWEKLCLK
jgi:hypothetical protein